MKYLFCRNDSVILLLGIIVELTADIHTKYLNKVFTINCNHLSMFIQQNIFKLTINNQIFYDAKYDWLDVIFNNIWIYFELD